MSTNDFLLEDFEDDADLHGDRDGHHAESPTAREPEDNRDWPCMACGCVGCSGYCME